MARRYRAQTLEVSDSLDAIQILAEKLRQQVDASLEDPQTRTLTLQVVNGAYRMAPDPRLGANVPVVQYHGGLYRVSDSSRVPQVCRPRDYRCELVRIWNFNVLNCRYVADLDMADTYQDLRTTLENGGGDCDDMTIAMCSMFRAIGYQCGARIISQRGDKWDHVYPLISVPRVGWVALDATEDGKYPGWEFPTPAKVVDFEMGEAA